MKKMTIMNALGLLNMETPFTIRDLKVSYKKAMLSNHPDKGGSTEATQRINQALGLLTPTAKADTATAEIDKEWINRRHAHNEGHPLHSNRLPSMDSFETLLKESFGFTANPGKVSDLYDTNNSIHHAGFYYQEDGQDFYVSCSYGNWKQFSIQNVTTGGKNGAANVCRNIDFRAVKFSDDYGSNSQLITNILRDLLEAHNLSLTTLFNSVSESVNKALEADPKQGKGKVLDADMEVSVSDYGSIRGSLIFKGCEIHFSLTDEKGGKVLNPFTLQEVYKPLKALPERMTVKHLIRILVNGQFAQIKSHFFFTDDHLMDSALDFQKGYIENPLSVLKDWHGRTLSRGHAYTNNSTVSFGLHSNDSNSLVFVEGNRYSAFDLKEDILVIEGQLRLSSKAEAA